MVKKASILIDKREVFLFNPPCLNELPKYMYRYGKIGQGLKKGEKEMIAYIKGILTQITDESIIVDVQGIGYEIICANPFAFQSSMNEEVFVYTYHHVRDDAQILYGFKTEDEKYLFTKLISVSGIGPKNGLNIQGNVDVQEFVAAVEREDEQYLMTFPGIGKKTARQIILDLKGKLTDFLSIGQPGEPDEKQLEVASTHLLEAKEALKALGYTDQEIRQIMPQLRELGDSSTDEMIRHALTLLVKN